jgi:hypothetical protein
VGASGRLAEEADRQFGFVVKALAAADLEALGKRRDGAEQRNRLPGDRLFVAVGRVEREPGVAGSILVIARITTVPRSKGPATAGVITAAEIGPPS